MLQSHVIDIDGAFAGVAVRSDRGFMFVATDLRVEELDGSVWPTLSDVKRLVRGLFLTGRLGSALATAPLAGSTASHAAA